MQIRNNPEHDPVMDLYIVDAYMLWALMAAEEVVGKNGLTVVLRQAGLEPLRDPVREPRESRGQQVAQIGEVVGRRAERHLGGGGHAAVGGAGDAVFGEHTERGVDQQVAAGRRATTAGGCGHGPHASLRSTLGIPAVGNKIFASWDRRPHH